MLRHVLLCLLARWLVPLAAWGMYEEHMVRGLQVDFLSVASAKQTDGHATSDTHCN